MPFVSSLRKGSTLIFPDDGVRIAPATATHVTTYDPATWKAVRSYWEPVKSPVRPRARREVTRPVLIAEPAPATSAPVATSMPEYQRREAQLKAAKLYAQIAAATAATAASVARLLGLI